MHTQGYVNLEKYTPFGYISKIPILQVGYVLKPK